MSEQIPKRTPEGLMAGNSVRWSMSARAYGQARNPEDGWVMTYELRNPDATITITGADGGDSRHLFSLTPAVTDAYPPGLYQYAATVSDGVDKFGIETGQMLIEDNFATTGEVDKRTWAQRALEWVEKTLLEKSMRDESGHSIEGRSLTREALETLTDWRDSLRAEVAREKQAALIRQGKPTRNRVLAAF